MDRIYYFFYDLTYAILSRDYNGVVDYFRTKYIFELTILKIYRILTGFRSENEPLPKQDMLKDRIEWARTILQMRIFRALETWVHDKVREMLLPKYERELPEEYEDPQYLNARSSIVLLFNLFTEMGLIDHKGWLTYRSGITLVYNLENPGQVGHLFREMYGNNHSEINYKERILILNIIHKHYGKDRSETFHSCWEEIKVSEKYAN